MHSSVSKAVSPGCGWSCSAEQDEESGLECPPATNRELAPRLTGGF